MKPSVLRLALGGILIALFHRLGLISNGDRAWYEHLLRKLKKWGY